MASNILQSAKDFLANSQTIRLAHLVRIELPGGTGSYSYYTDFGRDIEFDGDTYLTGSLKSISDVKQTSTLSAYTVSIKISGAVQTELDKAMQSQSYLNRVVSVWRLYLDDSGEFVPFYEDGSTLLFFEGTITEVSAEENLGATGRGSSTLTWKCANEFYDLQKVNGRLTDDASHRGVVVDDNGNEVGSTAAKRPEYVDDLGFFHSNTSINILAEYQVQQKAYRLNKKKRKWYQITPKYEMEEYWETVTKEIDMRFSLEAQYLPVIYGVQKVDGIPVFADTLVNDPTKVYVVYAFCEGEIDGFLDIWMDDAPMVCLDSTDSEERSCFGIKRAYGDTISIATPSQDPSAPSLHGQEYLLNDGDGDVTFWTYHGKSNQTACSALVNLAASSSFYLQKDGAYGSEYWDSRFKLLDTAYVVAIFDINENRTNIPTISAEIQGKKIPVYDNDGLVSSSATSLNPAWQDLDYLTSERYGAGIPIDRVDLDSFIEVANLLSIEDESYSITWLPYWRYIGWLDNTTPSRRNILQTCPVVDSSVTVFKNMDSMLQQTVCSLNIVEGKYSLTVESEKEAVAELTLGDFSGGKITVSDVTSKNKYNSVSASIIDPGLGWQTNTITFYNTDYKEEDSNVEKRLNMSFPYITNYYTARSLAERELKKSRYNREVTLTLPHKFIDLPVNSPVTITYPRFSWESKQFLLREVVWKANGKVQVLLREYTDDVFINSPQVDKGDSQIPTIESKVKPPRDFQYVPSAQGLNEEGVNGTLRWLPSYTADVTYYSLSISGDTGSVTIPVTDSPVDPNKYMEYILRDREAGTYTFALRAVSGSRGFVSSPVIIVIDVDPAKNLSAVTDFDLTNNIAGDENIWKGSDVSVTWSPIPEEDLVTGLRYELEILDDTTYVNGFFIENLYEFTYSYTQNKLDYFTANDPNVGVFRDLTLRIRAVGPNGEQSVAWTYL